MKLLLDSCVAKVVAEILRRDGHDIVWAGEWDRDPGDEQILRVAAEEGRAVVTLDKDFGELAIVRRQRHCGIVRLVDIRIAEQGPRAAIALRACERELAAGAIVTIEPGRIRIRPAESA